MTLHVKQENIPVGCVPPTYQPYMFRRPQLDVSTGGERGGAQVNNCEQVTSDDHQMSIFRRDRYLRSDVQDHPPGTDAGQ